MARSKRKRRSNRESRHKASSREAAPSPGHDTSSSASSKATSEPSPSKTTPAVPFDRGLAGLAALSALIFVAHWFVTSDPFLGSGTDIVTFEYPALLFAHTRLQAFDLPLWNPTGFGGNPFQLGAHSLLSPSFWSIALLEPLWDIKFGFTLHLVVATTGMAFWLRQDGCDRSVAWLGALAFGLSGFFTSHIYAGHRALVFAAAFLPWLIAGFERWRRHGRWGVAVLAATLFVFTGHYHIVYIGWLGVGAYLLVTALLTPSASTSVSMLSRLGSTLITARRLAVVVGASIGLAAVNILPTAVTAGLSQRAEGSLAFAAGYASAPANLLSYVVPTIFGGGDHAFVGDWAFWESFGYFGWVPLAALVIAPWFVPWRRVAPAAAVIAVATLLSWGMWTPVFEWFVQLVPGASMFRSPGRYVLLVSLFGAKLAADMLQAWLQSSRSMSTSKRAVVFMPAIIATSLAVLIGTHDAESWRAWILGVAPGLERIPSAETWKSLWQVASTDAVAASVVLILFSAVIVASPFAYRRHALWCLAMATAVELFVHAQPFLRTGAREKTALPTAVEAMLAQRAEPGLRIIVDPHVRQPGAGAAHGITHVGGYDIFVMANAAAYANAARGREPDEYLAFAKVRRFNPWVHRLGPRYYLTDRAAHLEVLNGAGFHGWRRVDQADGYALFEDPTPHPRVWLSHNHEHVSRDQALERLAQPAFDLQHHTLLSDPLHADEELAPVAQPEDERVDIVDYEPDAVTLDVHAAAPALVVLSDTWHPDWQAWVDGRRVPVHEANVMMRAVAVPAGRHRVEMRFVPRTFEVGAWLSLVAGFVVFAMVLHQRRQRRHGERTN